jgi:hypothetical protein
VSADNTLTFDGLDELREQLRQLPADLTEKGIGIVTEHAQAAERAIETGYPIGRTGNLRRRVVLERSASTKNSCSFAVRSRAPHASIFERGTVERHTKKGFNRGRMPQQPESERLIPKAIRIRKRMTDALIDLVREAGFEVQS